MANLTITPANVVPVAGAQIINGTAGATVTAGQLVRLNTATQRWVLSDVNAATEAERQVEGIALNGASNGQPLGVQTGGSITLGATLVVGEIYVGSDTPGGIMPEADLSSGEYVAILGVAISTTVLKMGILNSNVAV